jgi:hypothetical protein
VTLGVSHCLALVHIFHVNALTDNLWVAHALSRCIPIRYGRIASISARHDATKFAGPHTSHMHQYIIKCLFIQAQPMWALIDTGGGYHRGAQNLWSRPLSTFPFIILHFPHPVSNYATTSIILLNPHRTSIDRKGPITSRFQPLVVLIAYTTKHSILWFIFFHGGK